SLLFSIVFMVVGYFTAETIVSLMDATGDLYEYSVIYLKYSYFGIPFIFLYFVYAAVFQAQGKNTIPTIISTTCVILNMVLNPLFIFDVFQIFVYNCLGLGVMVAALATARIKAWFIVFVFI